MNINPETSSHYRQTNAESPIRPLKISKPQLPSVTEYILEEYDSRPNSRPPTYTEQMKGQMVHFEDQRSSDTYFGDTQVRERRQPSSSTGSEKTKRAAMVVVGSGTSYAPRVPPHPPVENLMPTEQPQIHYHNQYCSHYTPPDYEVLPPETTYQSLAMGGSIRPLPVIYTTPLHLRQINHNQAPESDNELRRQGRTLVYPSRPLMPSRTRQLQFPQAEARAPEHIRIQEQPYMRPQIDRNLTPPTVTTQPKPRSSMKITRRGNRNSKRIPYARGGTRDWSTDLCTICDHHFGTFCAALWCPCVIYGKNKRRIEYLTEQEVPKPANENLFCSGDCALHAFLTSFCLVGWSLQVSNRANIRRRYDIEGDWFGDCAAACCCSSCELAQESREIGLEELSYGIKESRIDDDKYTRKSLRTRIRQDLVRESRSF